MLFRAVDEFYAREHAAVAAAEAAAAEAAVARARDILSAARGAPAAGAEEHDTAGAAAPPVPPPSADDVAKAADDLAFNERIAQDVRAFQANKTKPYFGDMASERLRACDGLTDVTHASSMHVRCSGWANDPRCDAPNKKRLGQLCTQLRAVLETARQSAYDDAAAAAAAVAARTAAPRQPLWWRRQRRGRCPLQLHVLAAEAVAVTVAGRGGAGRGGPERGGPERGGPGRSGARPATRRCVLAEVVVFFWRKTTDWSGL
jgi:hypothetical protein